MKINLPYETFLPKGWCLLFDRILPPGGGVCLGADPVTKLGSPFLEGVEFAQEQFLLSNLAPPPGKKRSYHRESQGTPFS